MFVNIVVNGKPNSSMPPKGPNCPTWVRDGLFTLFISAQCLPQ